ncbi:transposable element Tcb2 transposase [Trichonephila clavipes]|nr:transposable element Tcb2 transposase [Trichonephila clavipes]
MLGRRIAARQLPPTCLPELRKALLDEWCNIPQDQIDNLILSMTRRCEASIASSGRHTPYMRALATDLVILNHGHVKRMTPELEPLSPNFHTTATGGRLSSRQILLASLPYTADLQRY